MHMHMYAGRAGERTFELPVISEMKVMGLPLGSRVTARRMWRPAP